MKIVEFDKLMAPVSGSGDPMSWHEPGSPPFRLAGFAWYEQDRAYRRLPANPPVRLPDAVHALANCTAGGQAAFRSDSKRVAVRVELSGRANMNHMPATGQCGFDLYVGEPFLQRFHSVTKYDHSQIVYETLLFDHPKSEMRCFTLNFPLYQGVRRVQIGLMPGAEIQPPPAWAANGRIVIYGTSITQGGCASRPGMAYTNILSRRLNLEVINLGFSGSGKGEPEVVEQVGGVPDPMLFVLDYEANAGEGLAETLPQAIRILRRRHPAAPILVVSRIAFSSDITHEDWLAARERSRDMQSRLVAGLRDRGDKAVYFQDGSRLLGADFDECTVDGVHPNDLGFARIAGGLEHEIRKILRMHGTGVSGRC